MSVEHVLILENKILQNKVQNFELSIFDCSTILSADLRDFNRQIGEEPKSLIVEERENDELTEKDLNFDRSKQKRILQTELAIIKQFILRTFSAFWELMKNEIIDPIFILPFEAKKLNNEAIEISQWRKSVISIASWPGQITQFISTQGIQLSNILKGPFSSYQAKEFLYFFYQFIKIVRWMVGFRTGYGWFPSINPYRGGLQMITIPVDYFMYHFHMWSPKIPFFDFAYPLANLFLNFLENIVYFLWTL